MTEEFEGIGHVSATRNLVVNVLLYFFLLASES